MFKTRSVFLALAGLGGAALTTAAHANDFSGAKVGVHVDYLWSKVSPSGFANAGDKALTGYDADKGGGGASIGYDWQSDKLVYGVFASLTATKLKGSTSQALTVHENEGTTVEHHGFDTDLSQLASLGGRVGMVVNDNTLVYAQAAVVSGRLKIHETGDNAAANASRTRSGYSVGVGTEMQINDKWSVGVEWNHYDLGKASFAPARLWLRQGRAYAAIPPG
ncbi:MAG: outer membrane beta-barrel protein [Asticcacaulis sp.]